MKFEDFLMQRGEDQQKILDLEAEVVRLQGELDEEQRLNRVLQYALHKPLLFHSCHSSLFPVQVRMLLTEIAMVEEEIICLERKIEDLKLNLYQEQQQTREWKLQQQQREQKHFLCGLGSRKGFGDLERYQSLRTNMQSRSQRVIREKRTLDSDSEFRSMSKQGEEGERSSQSSEENQNPSLVDVKVNIEKPNKLTEELTKPNKLSEELIKCLISIFLKLNQEPTRLDSESTSVVPKLTLSCMSSKGFTSKTSFNCKTPMSLTDDNRSTLDPYSTLLDLDGLHRDIGTYKNCIHLTRSSLDMSRVSQCLPAIGKLSVLLEKLCYVDLSLLTYKQKLAFWINTYNACIMHAFLQHGLPCTPDKLLNVMNKAVLNVGGIVLNALAIEHFILRRPCPSKTGVMDEMEALLRHAYWLGYPEPNVTFALCRGSWTSPALRVYTAENVVSELETAKVEFLEASVGVSSKKKIVVPKLLHWHMQDFADNIESLLEWIYSQLPRSGSLKQSMMKCLSGAFKLPTAKMVEFQPYESEFRYLLPM